MMSTTAIDYRRPALYPRQERAIFAPVRYACIEASTKSGKTHGCLIWIVEQALHGQEGWNYWWVAPVSDQADIAFRRLKLMIPAGLYEANETRHTITLFNGTTIWCKSAERPDLLYGEDVHAAVVDEASRVRTDSWTAVRSTLTATKGPVRLIGNVKGRKNWFYKMCRRAQQGHPRMHWDKITAWDAVEAGVLAIEEVLDAMEMLPDNVFRELYEAEAADDGGNPFGIDHIDACIFRDADGNRVGGLAPAEPVAWGWDLAKGYNFTVGIGLDREGRVCRFDRFQAPWEEVFRRVLSVTGKSVPAMIDATPGSGGDPILERLHADGHQNFESFRFTLQSKQALMVGLAAAIQKREISFPEGPIVDELEAFEYEYGTPTHGQERVFYRAGEGFHDDCVDALGLAVECKARFGSLVEVAMPSVAVGSNYFAGAG